MGTTDEPFYTATTDAEGKATFTRLPYGTYYVMETNAPDGYRLGTKLHLVSVTADSINAATDPINNYNASLPGWLPETGTLATIPFYVLGVGLIGLFFVLRRRSQRAEQTADN